MDRSAEQPGPRSATFDAFMRLQTGQPERTIADRINDKSRPTWEQYKKDNEHRFDAADLKQMLEYRRELDASREAALKDKKKKHKKHKKHKKKKRGRPPQATTA
ncbi:hypothetical protein CTAYLR_007781 [Chrysophaeum taylorii]|uniref:Uncharacterized protein n=1 Tax=Chrysophaeum taylorii TaxID=2483200 RepID=A0AAD7XNY1_9STRA|nr:hypothetical protein CTAYLR_007781 [Chrysophaeum taylorii]